MKERARTHIFRIWEQGDESFWLGFVAGQAEKVWLGVCPAAMFRPDATEYEDRCNQVALVAAEYGLSVTTVDDEIWIHREDYDVGKWVTVPINSADYHRLRAQACGISDIDEDYHQRQ